MSKHHISNASELSFGAAYNPVAYAANGRNGVPITPLTKISLGSPVTLDADGLIVAATSTELPNATTKTYTTATDNTTPLDGAIAAPSTVFLNGADRLVWVLDAPRNITGVVTHSTTTLAMTVTINGYDMYGAPMSEILTFAATATSIAAAGKKAFKYIYSYVITAAGNATTNTLNLGWGDVLGLPYRLPAKSDLMQSWFNEVIESTAATAVVGDATTATATTGDVRGTVDLNSALDGSAVSLWCRFDPSTESSLHGVAQA
jgi:hypothetical protein